MSWQACTVAYLLYYFSFLFWQPFSCCCRMVFDLSKVCCVANTINSVTKAQIASSLIKDFHQFLMPLYLLLWSSLSSKRKQGEKTLETAFSLSASTAVCNCLAPASVGMHVLFPSVFLSFIAKSQNPFHNSRGASNYLGWWETLSTTIQDNLLLSRYLITF